MESFMKKLLIFTLIALNVSFVYGDEPQSNINKNIRRQYLEKQTPFIKAIENNDIAAVQNFLKQDKKYANEANSNGRPALIVAVYRDNPAMVNELLANGADPNKLTSADGSTESALLVAASNGNKEIVKALLAYKANISFVDHAGNTPESIAREEGHIELANYLKEFDRKKL